MTRSCKTRLGHLAFSITLQFVGTACLAQSASPGFEAYKHVRAAVDDGAPDGLLRIAQTSDGYIWLAGDALYRFDGATFERIDWPQGSGKRHASPSTLMVSDRGELWVGLRDTGGVAVYRQGELRDMHMPDPPRGLAALAQAPDGTVWASSMSLDKRLERKRGNRWERVDEALGLPRGYIMDLIVARSGRLWIALSAENGESGSLAYLDPHAVRFQRVPVQLSGRPKIALDHSGALWVSDAAGTRILFDARGMRKQSTITFPAVPGVTRAAIAFDRSGGLWGTTASVGIFHIASPQAPFAGPGTRVRRFDAANGLTSDTTYAPFVDREGNVWITTENGIDQFRRSAAPQDTAVSSDSQHGLSMARAKDGSIYVGSRGTVFRVSANGAAAPILKLRTDEISMCPARGEGVWVIEPGQLILLQGQRAQRLPGYPGGEAKIACAEDAAGRLWLGLASGVLLWRDSSGWHRANGALDSLKIWDLTTTASGDLALIIPPDVAILHGNRLEKISLERTGIGTPWAVMPGNGLTSQDLFVSGSAGLARKRGNQLRILAENRFPWITWVRTLQQTRDGKTWLFSRTGVYQLATADLDRAFEDPHAPLPFIKFDALDGLASTVQQGGFAGPQSAVGGDGRIWFLNRQGAAFFDPAKLQPNIMPPPLTIRSLESGGRTWRDPVNVTLPPDTRTVNIVYAGLSFTVPQRVQFRYRLQGVDDAWIDAGARRTASYTNLGPGRYSFRVIARNSGGVWNRQGATLAFEIEPTFMQSWPFKLMCAAAILALMWLAYSLRLRTVADRIRMRMAERAEERERIARELHDTLLQSVQSLTLRFQLAADDLPDGTPARASLITAIDTADKVIAEGRDRVRELRTQQDGDLQQIICDLIARLEFSPSVVTTISSDGEAWPLEPAALEEITRIASEALFNIRRHAQTTELSVEVHHGANLQIRFADNGCGIDAEVARVGEKAGHYGLVGMTERARRLRGRLVIQRRADHGTEVLLTVPGAIAYQSRKSRRWSF
ncbi:signal transduction histidine kinase [Novosphingobium sp. PhB165]|uniref:sensor histidine kinase n=1 Tax=Novosphingobium sp. PhB165 TaxID=2485105 RepID=UPI00104BC7B8|nr:sensor histidine kinase [Novosphingobium sp. PhB165]TCM14173.1 signal transduction histidine kinase [Novosphingobium sp. PhB165]